MKLLEQEIHDKSHLFSYKLTMQAMKIYNKTNNYRFVVNNKKVVTKINNKKKDIDGLIALTEKLKNATICPYKHDEIDKALNYYIR